MDDEEDVYYDPPTDVLAQRVDALGRLAEIHRTTTHPEVRRRLLAAMDAVIASVQIKRPEGKLVDVTSRS